MRREYLLRGAVPLRDYRINFRPMSQVEGNRPFTGSGLSVG